METVILEKTIVKLGTLLALGFGEAGANIVRENIAGNAGVNAMVRGKRVECIIGMVRVRDFGAFNKVLQGDIFKLVNQIAEIVHGVANEYGGSANRNHGDHFLVVWRVSDDELANRLAEASVVGFSRILGAAHTSPVLAAYRGHPKLQQLLGSKCRVNLSFGLHKGWAIEGAVGSEFKIDASYLSPNVSIADSVEHATRLYSVSVLLTEKVQQLCSHDMQAVMRRIDKVLIHGSLEPLELFCIDLDVTRLKVDAPLDQLQFLSSAQRFRLRQNIEVEKNRLERTEMPCIWEQNVHIQAMCLPYTFEFREIFKTGFQNYIEGEWEVSRIWLQRTLKMLSPLQVDRGGRPKENELKDGPSEALLRFMDRYDFHAPASWPGFRKPAASGEI